MDTTKQFIASERAREGASTQAQARRRRTEMLPLPCMFSRRKTTIAQVDEHSINMSPSKFETLQSLKGQLKVSMDVPQPRVVCIGLENAGKSSVVERLINVTIFPRDKPNMVTLFLVAETVGLGARAWVGGWVGARVRGCPPGVPLWVP